MLQNEKCFGRKKKSTKTEELRRSQERGGRAAMLSGAHVLRILEFNMDLRRGGSYPCGDTGPEHLGKRQEPLQMVRCQCPHRPAPSTCSAGTPVPSARQERGKLEGRGGGEERLQAPARVSEFTPGSWGPWRVLTTEQNRPQGKKPQTFKFLGNYYR